jgi:hypothetical protein
MPVPIATPPQEMLRPPLSPISWAFTRGAVDRGLLPSMGSIGDCDDVVIESFWSRMQLTLSTPTVAPERHEPNRYMSVYRRHGRR